MQADRGTAETGRRGDRATEEERRKKRDGGNPNLDFSLILVAPSPHRPVASSLLITQPAYATVRRITSRFINSI